MARTDEAPAALRGTGREERLIDGALFGFMASHALFAADGLGLLRALAAGGPRDAAELARQAGASPQGVERLLQALVVMGVLDTDGRGAFHLPDGMRPYFADGPLSCVNRLRHFAATTTRLAEHLREAVVENRPQWERTFGGEPAEDQFQHVFQSPEGTRHFFDTMWGLGYASSVELVAQFDFGRCPRVVDVGGGNGSFAIPLLQAYPGIRATVFDRREAVPAFQARRAEFGMEDRLSFVAGDMFRDPLPPADAYALGFILSDWSREDGTRLLRKIHDALPPGGMVVVLERLFDEDKRGPFATAMADLVMMLEMRGRHYSAAEYGRWLAEAGFGEMQVFRSTGDKHMLVARRKDG